jgi:fructose-bisphosphate aldolase class II
MALVSARDMLLKAHKEGYGIAQININNLEWIKATLEEVEALQSPVILGVSEGAAKYMGGYKNVMGMVKEVHDFLGVTVPVAVHLDHGSYDGAKKALDAGFTSIMFDGSHYPFDENLAKTKEVVAMCHAKGVSVEAEVGSIGGEEDGVIGGGEIADPEECRQIAATGVDMFAAGIGNIHGMYPASWTGLNFDVLKEVQDVTGGVPLVLHGGSGIPDDMVKKAISLGVSKINVNTECQLAFAKATREYIEQGLDQQGKGFDPRKLLKPGTEAIKEVIKTKLTLFGSVNKA